MIVPRARALALAWGVGSAVGFGLHAEAGAQAGHSASHGAAGQGVPPQSVAVDRVVVRFSAPEIGGVDQPRFIYERILSFEARLEALADPSFEPTPERPYRDVHLRSAIERHIAETILESLEVSPPPSAAQLEQRVGAARLALTERARGLVPLDEAVRAEGLTARELLRIVQRQARASLYLDRMVAPMLAPSDAELRLLHQSGRTQFSKLPYESISAELARWYVGKRLREAVIAYYEGARSRVVVRLLGTAAAAQPSAP